MSDQDGAHAVSKEIGAMLEQPDTGAERLEQVREALTVPQDFVGQKVRRMQALHALDGCVLLTAEEADAVRTALNELMRTLEVYVPQSELWDGPTCGRRVLPLLTPERKEIEHG
jgi:hypothetical protein